ncbi:ABC transporter ATP-binding protein [Streptococcus xiaochunlingii]|uniref:ABC transporter ATP-binding protein n=1 Tax=Streptococcus xiaochunlingii TaxID=2589788 RepID=A0ABY2YGA9_9STRE|nr:MULTISPECIES: ABC transporter ATP-binding protein [Streptococcus]AMP66990.1 ABC transporter ATP-binding protein [Streptococcus sp. A12]MDK8386385.1 ABC transporter ATP-binding protein [Streptococcus xiaochunlingii]MDK8777579.1 ABC transporter ATP-binding protein [Streptococcus xiaochunlingii]RSK02368.1 putative multidrug resistance ABC transporter ATP-binding/permease protein YheH [Streptococcus sp. A12]RSK12108.1 putative multidrug resistance ABC transporter ATP-binding/permease protein Yh
MGILKRLLQKLSLFPGIFGLGFICLLLATILSDLSPFILQKMIDGPLTALSQGGELGALYPMGVLYLIVLAVGQIVSYIGNRVLIHGGNKVTAQLRDQAFLVMQQLPISYFDDKPAGKIATRIVNDTETLRTQFYNSCMYLVIHLMRFFFIMGVLFTINPMMGLLLCLIFPIFYGIQSLYKRMTDKPMKDFFDSRSEINTQVNELLHGASMIQLYGQEERVIEEFDQTTEKMTVAYDRLVLADSIASWSLTEFLKYIVIAGILTIAGLSYLGGDLEMTAGFLFINLNYVIQLFDLMANLIRRLPDIRRSLETGERVLTFLDEKVEADATKEIQIDRAAVEFDHVTFAYEEGKPVLKDISIQACPGQTLALVGHTGSGKSSIMNLLYRFYDPQEGEIRIDGQNIRHFSRESLRSHMGIVLQDPYLFSGTIASNVAMSQTDIDRDRVLDALKQVGALPMIQRLEKGIDHPVVEKGSAFSSGERQLISFARTLYMNPKILILDEATSHIDTETEEIIQKAMAVLQKGRTTFIIAHRLSTIQDADQILVLSEGRIVERGQHADLIAHGGIYAQMQAIQQTVE